VGEAGEGVVIADGFEEAAVGDDGDAGGVMDRVGVAGGSAKVLREAEQESEELH
jgi:hypothetical protein